MSKVGVVTTKLNLLELHFGLLRKFGKKFADEQLHRLLPCAIDFDEAMIIRANEFKLEHHKNDISFVDALGYVMALSRGIRFLTGDKQFKGLQNVAFIH